jgi:hypothetical protein
VTPRRRMFTHWSPEGFSSNRTNGHTRHESSPDVSKVYPVPELLTTVLAKALVMLVEALLTRLFIQLMRSGFYRDLRAAGVA